MGSSAATDALRAASLIDDEDRLVAGLRSLKAQRSPRASRVTEAVRLLAETKSARVRNAAALTLADLRAHTAEGMLIEVLARPETKGTGGTLLYALARLRAQVPLPLLAQIVAEESYEAREEALALLAGKRIEASPDELRQAETALAAAVAPADAERRQAIERARRVLQTRHHRDVEK